MVAEDVHHHVELILRERQGLELLREISISKRFTQVPRGV